MAELWTFSGINSEDGGTLVDTVGAQLADHGLEDSASRSYVSRLGTGSFYEGDLNVLRIDPEWILDGEASGFADGTIDPSLGVQPGELLGRRVCAIFVAPKSSTRPAAAFECLLYWGAHDAVPRQKLDPTRAPSLTYWRNWATELRTIGGSASVYPVKARHGFDSFLAGSRPIVKRKRKYGGARKRRQQRWINTKRNAPDPVDKLRDWLSDAAVEIVMVGHSQGANIALSVLNRGLVGPDEANETE